MLSTSVDHMTHRGHVLLRRGDQTVVGGESTLRYQIASASKQFTAAAVLVLAQEGKLAPEDPLDRWIPGWPGVTLHQLLCHTSGIGHWEDYPMIPLDSSRLSTPEAIEVFRSVPPVAAPGERWRYSSPAFVLAARVVELVSGQAYPEFLASRVFGPAGMTATFAGAAGGRDDLATGHDADGKPRDSWDLDGLGRGAGDVWSTTGDMVTWLDAIQTDAVVRDPWRSRMLSPVVETAPGSGRWSGYGVFVGNRRGEPWFYHDGDNAGFKSFAACLPRSERRLVILSNDDTIDAPALRKLLDRLLR
jgi:CubicO group peptidase (beta-lactamase class C family)